MTLKKGMPILRNSSIIFAARVGSHAYGTNVEGSDEDFKGVYLQSPEDILERGYMEQVTITKDEVYYELRRFVELCCTGNPTMLELLYSPEDCILYRHDVWDHLMVVRNKFLSKSCRYSFGGYAFSQIDKAEGLNKKMNWEKEDTQRKTVLDFCYVLDPDNEFKSLPFKKWLEREGFKQQYCGLCAIDHFRYTYALFYDHGRDASDSEVNLLPVHSTRTSKALVGHGYKGVVQAEDTSNSISLSDIPKYAKRETVLYFNQDGYHTHCKRYNEYEGWLKNRNTQRYVDVSEHGQKIDGKNLLHCIRLIEVGIEIAETHTINVRRPNADYLIEIRKGKHNLQEILMKARKDIERLDLAYIKSTLPDTVDRGEMLKLVTKIRKEHYEREKHSEDKEAS